MKIFFPWMVLSVGVFAGGCATSQNPPALGTVGPAISPAKTISTSTTGTLLVFSAFRRNADFNRRDSYRQEYSDYEIFSRDGKLWRKVHNSSDTLLQDAVAVALPVGKYQVKARANGYGIVTIPVMIAPQQQTVLHLEGGGFWPDESVFNQTNAVRLPDGLIIGWKAAPDL